MIKGSPKIDEGTVVHELAHGVYRNRPDLRKEWHRVYGQYAGSRIEEEEWFANAVADILSEDRPAKRKAWEKRVPKVYNFVIKNFAKNSEVRE